MHVAPTWILLLTAVVIGVGCAASEPLPEQRGTRLRPCPNRPNCVSSLSTDPRHAIAPIAFSGEAAVARKKLLEVIGSLPRTRLTLDEGDFLRVEFTSAVFHFVDDVEFLIDAAHQLIHVRSASRVGYWDLGVNRRRVEGIRKMMTPDARQGSEP